MKKLSYKEQLLTAKWKKYRAKILEKREYRCEICKCIDKPLVIHHLQYVKGRMAWEYNEELLQVLCNKCHEEIHKCPICDDFHKEENCPFNDPDCHYCENCRCPDKLKLISEWVMNDVYLESDILDAVFFGGYWEDNLCYLCAKIIFNNWNEFLIFKGQGAIMLKPHVETFHGLNHLYFI